MKLNTKSQTASNSDLNKKNDLKNNVVVKANNKKTNIEDINEDFAKKITSLPKVLGVHPSDQKEIKLGLGQNLLVKAVVCP